MAAALRYRHSVKNRVVSNTILPLSSRGVPRSMSHTPFYQAHTPLTARRQSGKHLMLLLAAVATLSIVAGIIGHGFAVSTSAATGTPNDLAGSEDTRSASLAIRGAFDGHVDVPQVVIAPTTPAAILPSVTTVPGTPTTAMTPPARQVATGQDSQSVASLPVNSRAPIATRGPSKAVGPTSTPTNAWLTDNSQTMEKSAQPTPTATP